MRAQIEWDKRDNGAHTSNPDPRAAPLKPFAPPTDNAAKPFHWQHTARRYELDPANHIALAAYFNWLEEATYHYAECVGWVIERLKQENFIVLQWRHDAEFFQPVHYGDEIELVSRLIKVERVRGIWIQEMFQRGTPKLFMRD